jgi:hypothetical protein
MRTGDEGAYHDRLQTALLGRFDEVGNGITGPTNGIRGAPPALPELALGWMFQDTGLRGPEVAALTTVLIGPLLLVFLALLLRRISGSNRIALFLATLYTFVFLGALQRPINHSVTLPYTVAVLLCISLTLERKHLLWTIVSVLLLTLLPAIYFWSWTFLWAVAAILLFLTIVLPQGSERSCLFRKLLWSGGMVFVFALPLLVRTWVVQTTSPFFSEMALYRSGLYPTHAIESPERSMLLLLLSAAAGVLFWKRRKVTLLLPVSMVFGIFLAMHQNVLHGKDFMFSSHYYPYVCLSAVALCAWVLGNTHFSSIALFLRNGFRTLLLQWPEWLTVGITAVFLIAGMWDYRVAWSFIFTQPEHLHSQHLAPALQILSDGKRETVLTDPETALMVKAWTDDDVPFTPYVQHLLVSNAEFAARACMASLLSPQGPDVRAIAWHTVQYRGEHLLEDRVRELQPVCDALRKNPRAALRFYHVDLLLWNEAEHPEWRIDPLLFTVLQTGEGWSLWRLKEDLALH